MPYTKFLDVVIDHCRIGSLEMHRLGTNPTLPDHCRIGSLEMLYPVHVDVEIDHCRIGSLEIK